jgi:putative SOS response-associated peptidase YedK
MEDSPELREIAEAMNRSPLMSSWQRRAAVKSIHEIRPTDVVPVIAPNKSGKRAVFPMQWGYSGKSLLINARVESAAEKPTFQKDWQQHRCVVPASWYFEWEHRPGHDGKKRTGDKYKIQPKDSTLTWLCGLYRIEAGLPHFVILTRDSSDAIRFIHDRMPLIMPEELIDRWIAPAEKPETLLSSALTDMIYEKTL